MSKKKSVYVCQDCGYDAVKWSGRCPGCGQWNTMREEFLSEGKASRFEPRSGQPREAPIALDAIATDDAERMQTGSGEMDRVLGNGLMPGSLILMVGDPGIGKSSLTLQLAAYLAASGRKVLYVTGEESTRQIRIRAERLDAVEKKLYVLSETDLTAIEEHIEHLQPDMVVIDSIQTMYRPEIESAPGSVSQVREGAAHLLRLTKNGGFTTIIIGHVTKDGTLAGPRVLEHIVDTVLYFEGERNTHYRILRAVKNRFGSTNEIGLFEMRQKGLVDVPDASRIFLAERALHASGSMVVPTMEGTRPLLVEIQALVSASPFVPPRRTSDSMDAKRIQLVLAVLEKRAGLHMGNMDVFVKVAGGIYVDEPAVDLGLAMALASSHRDMPLETNLVAFGEVGLSGEIRAVSRVEQRLKEAERMGFTKAIMPVGNLRDETVPKELGMEIIGVTTLREGLKAALGI